MIRSHDCYDSLSRLLEADYDNGTTTYTYGYDVAGNLVNNNGVIRTYNAANQMTHDGTNTLSYDNNGNLTGDGVNAYTWDRANRLLSVGNHSYVYDGLGNRVQQTVSSVVTDYLNDVQPGLVKLLRQDGGSNVDHFIHAPRGIHAVDDGTDWNWYMQDGLGSVRGLVDDGVVVQSSMAYDPYGDPLQAMNGFAFTGEYRDESGLQYHRARYYDPRMAVFPSLDPFEGLTQRPMSLNGYSWVEGNVVNAVDPSGKCWDHPTTTTTQQNQCLDAWNNYVINIDLRNPELSNLVRQEDSYWGGLSYQQFVNQWNNDFVHPTPNTNQSGAILSGGLPIAGGIAQADSPFPGPADVIGGIFALCVVGLAVWANSQAIALPRRQPYDFTLDRVEGTAIAPPIPLDRHIPRPTATPENDEFVGFHGTVDQFANDLIGGNFSSDRYGINERSAADLQFGIGIYVVKAQSATDDKALGLAEMFAMRAMQNQGSPAVVLKVYARGFSRMSRLLHIGNSQTLPDDYMSYDYIEGPVSGWSGYTQVKFNPHTFTRLSFRI